jgi:hypothetical protein
MMSKEFVESTKGKIRNVLDDEVNKLPLWEGATKRVVLVWRRIFSPEPNWLSAIYIQIRDFGINKLSIQSLACFGRMQTICLVFY